MLARQTPGFSGADIANVCNEAALIAARHGKKFVGKQVYVYLTVETSGTKQCLVKYVHTVGSGKDNHTTIGTEAVHFSQQLIQSVFTLIISTH